MCFHSLIGAIVSPGYCKPTSVDCKYSRRRCCLFYRQHLSAASPQKFQGWHQSSASDTLWHELPIPDRRFGDRFSAAIDRVSE